MVKRCRIYINNKYITISFVSILFSLFLFCLYTTSFFKPIYVAAQSSDGFLTYYNSVHGIKIEYPADWGQLDGPILNRLASNNTMPIVGFCPPDMSVSLAVAREKLQENMTLDQAMKYSISQLEKNQPSFRLIESNETKLADNPAYQLLYSGTFDISDTLNRFPGLSEDFGQMFDFGPVDITAQTYATIHNGSVYAISYNDAVGNAMKQVGGGIFGGLMGSMGASPCSSSSSTSPSLGILDGLFDQNLGVPPSSVSDPFYHYLPTAQRMIDSFSFDITQEEVVGHQSTQSDEQPQSNNEDPLFILKGRLAKGEISIEEYNELKEIITAS